MLIINSSIAMILKKLIYCIEYKMIEKFQITNGHTKLSTELASQLSNHHHCKVILICDQNNQINRSSHPNILYYQCNILKNAELKCLDENIAKDMENGSIDIFIENGKMFEAQSSSENCQQFIETTSQNIMATINVRLIFVFFNYKTIFNYIFDYFSSYSYILFQS